MRVAPAAVAAGAAAGAAAARAAARTVKQAYSMRFVEVRHKLQSPVVRSSCSLILSLDLAPEKAELHIKK